MNNNYSDLPDNDPDKNSRTDQTITRSRTEMGEIGGDDIDEEDDESLEIDTTRSELGAGE